VAAPGAYLGEARIGGDLDAPSLVFGQVPMEAVQLVPRHDGQILADFGG
jgi:hypothetical protein